MQTLKVSDNRRFLVHADGSPFFYLGDTAWELFHRLDRAESDYFLQERARQGFTVIQAVVLAEHEYSEPNAYGHLPLVGNDPTQPVEAYFEHVDWIVNRAEQLGLRIAMLPTWGDKWNKAWGEGPEIFTSENARTFGEFLGKRYAEKPIIWVLGGDRPVVTDSHKAVLRAMAEGLHEGDGGAHLRTLHPPGSYGSSLYFPDEEWLDFHMYQSGHSRNKANYECIEGDYALTPTKPCMDAEPGYEDHPAGFDIANGYLEHYDVRKSLYWALFAGAFGHTYGCHPMWQFWEPSRNPINVPRTRWQDALHFPGAEQQHHAKDLLLSRPFLTRIPDQSLVVSEIGAGTHHIQATRDTDGSYALIYIALSKPVQVDTDKLSGQTLTVYWFDPRTGTSTLFNTVERGGVHTFTPPGGGLDWVLVLDDAARNYARPSTVVYSRSSA